MLMSRHLCSSSFLQLIVVCEIEVALFFVVFVLDGGFMIRVHSYLNVQFYSLKMSSVICS